MFADTARYLTTLGRAGISFTPKKFQFCKKEVDYVGFRVHEGGLSISEKIISSIRDFPRPRNLKDMRSFMGLAEQTAPFLAKAQELHPFRTLLKSKTKEDFVWSEELTQAFEHAKNHLIQESEAGIRRFERTRTTMLSSDWSKTGMACTMFQKYCTCKPEPGDSVRLGCCKEGWKLVLMDSRFCTTAEANYAPIEGEICALHWAMSKFRYFVIGHPDLHLTVDHQPLLGIVNGKKDLSEMVNHRLIEYSRKLGMFMPFTLTHIAGTKNLAADAGSRAPVGDAASQRDGEDTMITGAGTFIMNDAGDIMTGAPRNCNKENKGPRIMLGLMMGALSIRKQLNKERPISNEAKEEAAEMEREENDLIESNLQEATGTVTTKEQLLAATDADKEYATLLKTVPEELPGGDSCKEDQQQRKGSTARHGTVSYTHLTLPTNREV